MPPRAAGRATFPRAAPEAGLAPARRQEAGLAPRVDGEGHRALGLTEEREGGREREDEIEIRCGVSGGGYLRRVVAAEKFSTGRSLRPVLNDDNII